MPISEKIRSPFAQLFFAVATSCFGTFIFSIVGTRTIMHALWLFVIPAVIGIALNEGKLKQVVMACILMGVSAISSIVLMYLFWGGY